MNGQILLLQQNSTPKLKPSVCPKPSKIEGFHYRTLLWAVIHHKLSLKKKICGLTLSLFRQCCVALWIPEHHSPHMKI